MASIAFADGNLLIELTVRERVLSLHPAILRVALHDVRGVRVATDALDQVRGERMPGARVRGVSAIGIWQGATDDELFRDFVLVERPGPGVVITTDGTYDRILLGSDRPDSLADGIRSGQLVRASGGRPPTA